MSQNIMFAFVGISIGAAIASIFSGLAAVVIAIAGFASLSTYLTETSRKG